MPPPSPVDDRGCTCTLFRCFCCWRRVCSPRIPRVAPGRDYVCIPAGADDRPAWSLLVGFRADSSLHLYQFRVAPSGRILGRSNDALEIFHRDVNNNDDNDRATTPISGAHATLSPDGRSLCIFCTERLVDAESTTVVPTRAVKLELDEEDSKRTAITQQLPSVLLGRLMACRPVTAAGDIWAPYFHLRPRSTCRLVMQRLDDRDGAGTWVEAGSIEFPYEMEIPMKWGGSIFQGYAVVHDTILVSLRPAHLFFSFNCSTCSWTAITTASIDNTTSSKNNTSSSSKILSIGITTPERYVPIRGRGVYVQEDDAIYFLQRCTIYAYKPLRRRDDQGQQTLVELKPPTKIDSVCPFYPDGFAFLTHLGGRVMCAVWIGVGRHCSCRNYHVLISTFLVKLGSDGIPTGIEVLHSTCRQLDLLPTALPIHEFCFLQEYNDENAMEPSMLLESSTEDITANSCGEDSSKMLDCCRKFLSKPPSLRCYVLQEPALHISTDLYVVCQADSRLIVYCTEIVDGRLLPNCNYNPLRLHQDMNTVIAHDDSEDCYAMEDSYPRYSIVRSLTSIYAVSYKPDDTSCEFELSRPSSDSLKISRPAGVCFAVVLNVGHRIVAVSHALEVFWFVPPRSSRFHAGNRHAPADRWKHCKTRRPDLVVNDRRVDLSGYVVLDADTFIVSDKETCRCFLLNMKVREWKDVLPDVKSRTLLFHDPLVYGRQRLNGRSIYVGGYIYSCTAKGLVAYDFHGGILDDAISLPFPWRKPTWERERMCLDLVGAADGAVIFCVVQGGYFSSPHGKDVHITIVQVKTTRTSVGKFRPVSIDHVDIATCFIPREDGVVSTRSCFSVKH